MIHSSNLPLEFSLLDSCVDYTYLPCVGRSLFLPPGLFLPLLCFLLVGSMTISFCFYRLSGPCSTLFPTTSFSAIKSQYQSHLFSMFCIGVRTSTVTFSLSGNTVLTPSPRSGCYYTAALYFQFFNSQFKKFSLVLMNVFSSFCLFERCVCQQSWTCLLFGFLDDLIFKA